MVPNTSNPISQFLFDKKRLSDGKKMHIYLRLFLLARYWRYAGEF